MQNKCAGCRYLDKGERKIGPDGDDTAMCRCLPPVVVTSPLGRPWPFVKLTDWCGHWTPAA